LKNTKTKKIKKQILKKWGKGFLKMNKALNFILGRNYEAGKKTYVNTFSYDDRKKSQSNYTIFTEIKPENYKKITDDAEIYNVGGFGVFISLNPLTSTTRKKSFVKNINFVFIDLDHAEEEDLENVKSFLNQKGFKVSYIAQSGSGYHLLIEVDLDTTKEDKVKNFLKYLHSNVSSKVDIATGDLTRLIRMPESEHSKKTPFRLKTLDLTPITDKKEYKNNNDLVLAFQLKEEKNISNQNYLIEVKRQDTFFSTILSNGSKWKDYTESLDSAEMRNNIFVKNLGIFVRHHEEFKDRAIMFISEWEKSRVKALGGWIKKAAYENMNVNYYELLKWSKENKLQFFEELLLEQVKETMMDKYEVYYLEEEKSENNCLLYYPEKNYYVQKSIYEVTLNIYYDCKEQGLDLVDELNLEILYDKWDSFNFKKQIGLILDQIRRILENENRIKLIYNINYAPNDEKFIYVDGKKYFNIYKKSLLLAATSPHLDDLDFTSIKTVLMNLCEKNEEYYNWFIQWIAWQIQYPTSKLPTAVIFQGEHGTGKGVLAHQILDTIFGNNVQEINQTHLESAFNEYLLGKQIIIANEVMHNENRQTLPNILKNLVTDEYITIQRKFRKELVCKNYTHWIFCTNSDNPIKIETGDRRYSVFKSKKLMGGGTQARKFVKTLIENKEHEMPRFLEYLRTIEVDEFLISNPIETQAKLDIVELNNDSTVRFIDFLKEFNNYETAYLDVFKDQTELGVIDSGDGYRYIKSEAFYLFYLNWAKKYGERAIFAKQNFGRKITSYGLINTIKKHESKSIRVYPLEYLNNYISQEVISESLKHIEVSQ
jgi:hypothetical protein